MFVVGLALLGITVFYYIFDLMFESSFNISELLFGFGFGASYIALFARVIPKVDNIPTAAIAMPYKPTLKSTAPPDK